MPMGIISVGGSAFQRHGRRLQPRHRHDSFLRGGVVFHLHPCAIAVSDSFATEATVLASMRCSLPGQPLYRGMFGIDSSTTAVACRDYFHQRPDVAGFSCRLATEARVHSQLCIWEEFMQSAWVLTCSHTPLPVCCDSGSHPVPRAARLRWALFIGVVCSGDYQPPVTTASTAWAVAHPECQAAQRRSGHSSGHLA